MTDVEIRREPPTAPPSWRVALYHDGGCPLCRREVAWMRRLDRGRGRVRFVDIADPAFDPTAAGRDRDTLMARIHARLPDGTWIEGVEAFRRVYGALGLGWVVAPTRLPGVRRLLDLAYQRFARRRYRRRCDEGACGIGAGDRALRTG